MYNTGSDVLLTHSDVLSIFTSPDKNFNTGTILSLWLALNMHNVSELLPTEPGDDLTATQIPKSNFRKLTKSASMLDIPLSTREHRVRDTKFPNCEESSDYVKTFLEALFSEETETQTET